MSEQNGRAKLLDDAMQRFGAAWAAGDVTVLESLLSPTYTHNDAFGAHHDRASWLAYALGRAGRKTLISFRDVKARIHRNAAIITGINDIDGAGVRSASDGQGLSILFTQVWIWHEGRWLREAFQATPIRSGPQFD